MKSRFRLLALILLFGVGRLYAHALWIETNPTGKIGQKQEAKIFFGEYAHNERDTTAKWFSNLRDVKLWVTLPNGDKQELPSTATTDYFSAAFTPSTSGIYTLSITHEVKDIYGSAKIQYYCAATVNVGASTLGKDNIIQQTGLAVQTKTGNTTKLNEQTSVSVFLKNSPIAKVKVTIALPKGEPKDIETSENGTIDFTPIKTGRYMVEALYTDKTPGTQNGKEYKVVWHCVTYCLDVI